ncbi:glycine cleavage H-protein [Chloroherpeton thalassium ATCC 35110]|uniref:Glycine cleavage H-protein n=1 Tax=Chloroherpeton thalassium (strain ATCC 35110 / GB-78) TaxID=517418 RepID=B3QSW8_CHLT3|nr:glycine cleavage system protein H [Chloroherpeton thalassium]ACF12611.1 glycine cleavage H-protein [Chloroherpeton thalassium ATCC 35110]
MPEINNCMLPEDLLYHVGNNVWIKVNDDGTIDLGMTDIAQSMAGSIIHCKPKKVGKTVEKGKSVATVESGKWVGPVKTPCSGEIIATNPAIDSDATILNKSPYKQGWIVRLKPTDFEADKSELQSGADAADGFKAYMKEKDFNECIHCEGFDG